MSGALTVNFVAVGGLICFVGRDVRLGLREPCDHETVRNMFDLCEDNAAAFGHHAC